MRSGYLAVLMISGLIPGLAFAQSSKAEFDALLNSSALCGGVTSQFEQAMSQQRLDGPEAKAFLSYVKQQGVDHGRVQARFIKKYINFLNRTEPGHGVTIRSLEARSNQLAEKAGKTDFSGDELSEKVVGCAKSIRAYYPYMFLYEDPNDERIRDDRSPLNRVVTYFGGFVQCGSIMQKSYVTNGDADIDAVKRSRSNLAQWYKILPKYIKNKLPSAGDEETLEYRDIFYNSTLLLTQLQWDKLDADARKEQVQACAELDKDVQNFGKSQ